MLLAELEVYHSRPIAPTRRVAVGESVLPTDPAPGFGGLLLGGVVAANIEGVDPDLIPDLLALTRELEAGKRIPQPRLRHRFQIDRIGLQRSTHRLLGSGEDMVFDFEEVRGNAAQQVLGAVYAAGDLEPSSRAPVFAVIRRAVGWSGPVGPDLLAALAGFDRGQAISARAFDDPVGWALEVLGFIGAGAGRSERSDPSRAEVQARFRALLRDAHPDQGGASESAASRIADLSEARRILIG